MVQHNFTNTHVLTAFLIKCTNCFSGEKTHHHPILNAIRVHILTDAPLWYNCMNFSFWACLSTQREASRSLILFIVGSISSSHRTTRSSHAWTSCQQPPGAFDSSSLAQLAITIGPHEVVKPGPSANNLMGAPNLSP